MPTTNYVWDSLNDSYLMETDQSQAVTATYTQEPSPYGGLISQRRGTDSSYFQRDNLGSTRLLTDDTGAVTDTFVYHAWGNGVDRTGATKTPFRWIGEIGYYFDIELGTFYIRARTYLPIVAQWISMDPIGIFGLPNMYSYIGNSPLSWRDPTGKIPIDPLFCDVNQKLKEAVLMPIAGPLLGYFGFWGLYWLSPQRWAIAGFWEVVDLNQNGTFLLDMVRASPGAQALQKTVEESLDAKVKPGCKPQTFRSCGTVFGVRSEYVIPNLTIDLVLGRYTIYWGAKCDVSSWTKGAVSCLASYKCTIKWMLYDEYDFEGLLDIAPPVNLIGKDYLITGTWETVAGEPKFKPFDANGKCCDEAVAMNPNCCDCAVA